MLVRIWDEIHADQTDLSELIEGLRHRFDLQNTDCDYCTKSKMPLKHYAEAIILCSLAGSSCQNLQFWSENGEEHTAYELSSPTGTQSHIIKTSRRFETYLKGHRQELLGILQKPYDMKSAHARRAAK